MARPVGSLCNAQRARGFLTRRARERGAEISRVAAWEHAKCRMNELQRYRGEKCKRERVARPRDPHNCGVTILWNESVIYARACVCACVCTCTNIFCYELLRRIFVHIERDCCARTRFENFSFVFSHTLEHVCRGVLSLYFKIQRQYIVKMFDLIEILCTEYVRLQRSLFLTFLTKI